MRLQHVCHVVGVENPTAEWKNETSCILTARGLLGGVVCCLDSKPTSGR